MLNFPLIVLSLFLTHTHTDIYFCHTSTMHNAHQTRWKYGCMALRLFAFDRVSATIPITNLCNPTNNTLLCHLLANTLHYIVMHFGGDSDSDSNNENCSTRVMEIATAASTTAQKHWLSTDTIALLAVTGSNSSIVQRMDKMREASKYGTAYKCMCVSV